MKKRLFPALLIFFFTVKSYGQKDGAQFQATLKSDASLNTVKVLLRPSASFSGQFSAVQFTFQLPASIKPQPVVMIKNNRLSAFIPTGSYVTKVTNEGGFYNYLFSAVPIGYPVYNFVTGEELEALGVEISALKMTEPFVRLASLAKGGVSGQMNFYIEINGSDKTNTAAMFYGDKAVNGGAYSKYSYIDLSKKNLRSEKEFKFVPNPTKNLLTVIAPNDFACEDCQLTIVDDKGVIAYQRRESFAPGESKKVVISSLAAGTYFLRLRDSEAVIFKQSFVKL